MVNQQFIINLRKKKVLLTYTNFFKLFYKDKLTSLNSSFHTLVDFNELNDNNDNNDNNVTTEQN